MNIDDKILRVFGPGEYTLINCSDKFFNGLVKENLKVRQLLVDDNNCVSSIDFFFEENVKSDYIILNLTNLQNISNIFELFVKLNQFINKGMFVYIEGKAKNFTLMSLENTLLNSGFTKHVGYYEVFCDYAKGFKLDYDISLIVQPLLNSIQKLNDLLVNNNLAAKWQMDAYTAVCNYIRPGDRVLDISIKPCVGGEVLNSRSFANNVSSYWLAEEKLEPSLLQEGSHGINCSSKYDISEIINDIKSKKNIFDFIMLNINEDNYRIDADILNVLFDFLNPGGRLIVLSTGAGIGDFKRWHDQIVQLYEIEQFYHCPMDSKKEYLEERFVLHNFNEESVPIDQSGFFSLLAMKSPLNVSSEEYTESVYNYSHPPANLLAFSRDYINPWLVRAVVEFPFRNRNPKVLRQYAEKILEIYPKYSADVGAAFGIIGYQELSNPDYSLAEIESLCTTLKEYCANPGQLVPHQIRWKISLLYLAGCLYKKINNQECALECFLLASEIDCTLFSPTIGTKTLLATYEAAVILASNDRITESGELLQRGLRLGAEILKCESEEIFGRSDCPHNFTLYIYHDILDVLIKISNAIRLIHTRPQLLYRENTKVWSSLLLERMNAIQEVEKLYTESLRQINGQADLIEERWQTIQSMDAMISERDKTIKEQTEIIDLHLKNSQDSDALLAEYKLKTEAQAVLVEERWNAIQEMDVMISERDQTIKEQAAIIDVQKEHLQKSEMIISACNIKIAEQAILIETGLKHSANSEIFISESKKKIDEQTAIIKAHLKSLQDNEIYLSECKIKIEEQADIIEMDLKQSHDSELLLSECKMKIEEQNISIEKMVNIISERTKKHQQQLNILSEESATKTRKIEELEIDINYKNKLIEAYETELKKSWFSKIFRNK